MTELALCLGINHKQIHWEYNQLYGFIGSKDPNKAEPVGWGPCNNPYFENDVSKMMIGNGDSRRTPFRNHACLSWSKKPMTQEMYNAYNKLMEDADTHELYETRASDFENGLGLELFMIDACGGPHYGTETHKTYEAHLQLIHDNVNNGDLAKSFSKYVRDDSEENPDKWEEHHHLGGGVSIPNNDSKWRLRNQLGQREAQLYKENVDKILGMLAEPNDKYGIQWRKISQVQDVFRNYIKGISQDTTHKWAKWAEVPIRSYTTEDNTTVYETKICYSEKETKPPDGQVAMRVALNSAGNIQKACASHLAYTALTSFYYLVKDRGAIFIPGYSEISTPGTFYKRVFVWFDISVEVFMDADHMWRNNSLMQMLLTKVDELKEHRMH